MEGSIFSVVNLVAAAGWVLLVVFPRRRLAVLVASRVVPALLSGAYLAIVVSIWGRSPGGFSSLEAVGQLFDNRWMLLAGWIHYLAFDLLVGSWMLQDAEKHGIPHGLLVPLSFLTFMFGPAGWLAYRGVRAAMSARRRALTDTSVLRSSHSES
ncbi:MAG TPA: ABA4-like family protein [Polyangiaceae bacterium]